MNSVFREVVGPVGEPAHAVTERRNPSSTWRISADLAYDVPLVPSADMRVGEVAPQLARHPSRTSVH